MAPATLVLRDIHQPPAPGWWPPAPGWWLLAALLLGLAVFAVWIARRRSRRKRAVATLFDDTVANAGSVPARVAAISELLRRASRRGDPAADRLQEDAWLRFLDGAETASAPFSAGAGRLLLDGGFRRDVDEVQLAALLPLARRRYLQLMAVRR